NIQRSIPDLATILAKLETEHPNTYLEDWLKEIQGIIKVHKTVAKAIAHKRQNNAIKRRITIRQEQYDNDKYAMINSVLERSRRQIQLDRLIFQQGEE
ncbi:7755_t:CDS:1, partial [Acaulospora colombiana]